MSNTLWQNCSKNLAVIFVLCAVLYFNGATGQLVCRNRTSWLTLSTADRTTFVDKIRNLSDSRNCSNCSSTWDLIATVHNQYATLIHGTPLFLYWHRAYVHFLETLIDFAIPYYDSATDCKGGPPSWCSLWSISSAASTTVGLGGNGDPNTTCVNYGAFSSGLFSVRSGNPSPRCLDRKFGTGALLPIQDVERLVGISTDAKSLRANCENSFHAALHVQMGGDMETMYSSSDPIFFMHHSWIDSKWYFWQFENESRITDASVAFEDPSTAYTEMPGLRYLWTTFLPNSSTSIWALTPAQVISVGGDNSTLCYNYTTTQASKRSIEDEEQVGETYKPFAEDTEADLEAVVATMTWPRMKLQLLPQSWMTENNLNTTFAQEFYDGYNAWVDRVNQVYTLKHPGNPPPPPSYPNPLNLPPGVVVTSEATQVTTTPVTTGGAAPQAAPEPEIVIIVTLSSGALNINGSF